MNGSRSHVGGAHGLGVTVTPGLVDVTDVSVEELLRCCVYLQHISLAERYTERGCRVLPSHLPWTDTYRYCRYIMPSDAHAQRFDAVTRDRAARKVRKKAKSKDLQFSKKQRKILAVVDKMMAEEEQCVATAVAVAVCGTTLRV